MLASPSLVWTIMYPDSTRRVPRRAKVCPLEIHGRQYILAIEKPLREIKKTYRTVSSSTIKVNDRRKSLCIRYVDRATLECTSRSVSRVVSIMSVVFNGDSQPFTPWQTQRNSWNGGWYRNASFTKKNLNFAIQMYPAPVWLNCRYSTNFVTGGW